MNQLDHLRECKKFLRNIAKHRRDLLKMGIGKKANPEMIKTLSEIDYNLGSITSFSGMMNFLTRKGMQKRLKQIIPKNKQSWHARLDNLIYQGNVLQGRITKQLELIYD